MACGCESKPGVGDQTNVQVPTSSGPGFFTGVAVGVLAGGALAVLLYVGLQDESGRRSRLAQRRAAGYAY